MQEVAQGTGHTPEVLTHTSKWPSTKAPLCPLHQPQARVPCSHALASPEHHHPAELLSTCWVTKGHPLHWVWVSYQGAWSTLGAWLLLCLLLGYVTGSQFPSFSFSANPTPPSWVPLNLSYMGGIPEQEGAASAPTYQSRECLLGGQRRKHSSACLSGCLHLHKEERNREKITCDKTF